MHWSINRRLVFPPSYLFYCRLRWNRMFLMTRCVMNVVDCIVVDAMLPTSVATSTACATTVSTAGHLSIQHQAHRTIVASSRRTETAPELSTFSPPNLVSPCPNSLCHTSCELWPNPWPPCKKSVLANLVYMIFVIWKAFLIHRTWFLREEERSRL